MVFRFAHLHLGSLRVLACCPSIQFGREGGQWKLHRDIWNSDTPAAAGM